jgi:hypothetical protein
MYIKGKIVRKISNAAVVIKKGQKMIMFVVDGEELLLMPFCCPSTLAMVSGVGGRLL